MPNKIKSFIKETDIILLSICMLASGIGLLVLYSMGAVFFSSQSIFIVQGMATFIGVCVALFISLIDYHTIARLWKVILPVALFLVILTFFIGLKRPGADDVAWLQLPGGLTFQPSELLKIAFIISFAVHLQKVGDDLNLIQNLLLLILHAGVMVFLVHKQGDDGSAIVFVCIFLFMLFAAGLSWKYIVTALLASPLVGIIMWFFVLGDHQKERILVVFDPERDPLGAGFQALQGKTILGAGQMWGRGLFSPDLKSVVEMQNDFIFAYIGQVLGFIGCLTVVCIMLAISIKILLVARKSKDKLGNLICVGVFSIFMCQVIINIGMSLSIMPVIGITLPFFSSGGTSVVISYISIGLVLSIFRHNKTSMFED